MSENTTTRLLMVVGRETSYPLIITGIPRVATQDALRIDVLHSSVKIPPFDISQTALFAPPLIHKRKTERRQTQRRPPYPQGQLSSSICFSIRKDPIVSAVFSISVIRAIARRSAQPNHSRRASPAVLAFCPSARG